MAFTLPPRPPTRHTSPSRIYAKYERLARRIGEFMEVVAPCCSKNMTRAEFDRAEKLARKMDKALEDLDYELRILRK
jgi:hypothetical protein